MTVQSDIKDYEQNWSALNVRLKEIERQQGGLDAALTALEAHQIESGFIKANLSDIERLTLHHPYDPEKFFRVQYNPVRALRFKGSGFRSQSSTPLIHTKPVFCAVTILFGNSKAWKWDMKSMPMAPNFMLG